MAKPQIFSSDPRCCSDFQNLNVESPDDCGSSDDKLSQPIGVKLDNHQKCENPKFDLNARLHNFAVMMPVFKPLELCETDSIEQWCCKEIFHTPTLTIGKKILPPSTALTTC